MHVQLLNQRITVRLGLAAAKRDGDVGRTALYQACLRDVNKRIKEQRRGTTQSET
jgi:hypothetical protein